MVTRGVGCVDLPLIIANKHVVGEADNHALIGSAGIRKRFDGSQGRTVFRGRITLEAGQIDILDGLYTSAKSIFNAARIRRCLNVAICINVLNASGNGQRRRIWVKRIWPVKL